MSIVTTGGIGVGFDIDQLSVGDLFFYDFSSLTGTTVFRVFDDALNYTEFTGTGFSATGIPGPLTDVTAGIIQTCTVVRQGVVILDLPPGIPSPESALPPLPLIPMPNPFGTLRARFVVWSLLVFMIRLHRRLTCAIEFLKIFIF